eukprot:XP_011416773.1 PREDICTED: craniofacial development protein 2-like [Crassostrea gigas]
MGETFVSHWTVTARLKLGSPQSIRYCPATVCYPHGKGNHSDEPKELGVGFAVKNSQLSTVEPDGEGSELLLTLCLNTTTGPITLVSVYAPTLTSPPETKDLFYEKLSSVITNIPDKEQLILLGDFNARVGADNDSWPSCLGKFDVGKMNENGQRLLELCSYYNLCIANSFFMTKPQHKVSWRHPDQNSGTNYTSS